MPSWIRITDKLPPKNIGILISDGKDVFCAEWDGKYWGAHGWGGFEWEWWFEYASEITHWMELPKLPSK